MKSFLSNPPRLIDLRTRTSIHLAAAVAACLLTACGTSDIGDSQGGVDSTVGENAMGPEQFEALRVASPPDVAADHTIDARLQAQAERGQRYLDELAPRLDGALRATAGVSYAELKAEVDAAVALGDTDAAAEALDRFQQERGPMVEAALQHMGMSSAVVATEVRRASLGEASPVVADTDVASEEAASEEVAAEEGGVIDQDGLEPIWACQNGYEYEPFPPYYEDGVWGTGGASKATGYVYARSEALFGGAPTDGAWVRADNIPPAGGGQTTVSTRVNFSDIQSLLTVFLPAYAGSGVGLTINIHDGGPWGTLIGQCRVPVLDVAIGWGVVNQNIPRVVNHSCTVNRSAASTFLTSKVQLDTYATTVGAQAVGMARGVVETIRYSTCQ